MIFDKVKGRSHVELQLYDLEMESIQNGTHNDWMSKFMYIMVGRKIFEGTNESDRADALQEFLAQLTIPGSWDQSWTPDDLYNYNPLYNRDWWHSEIIRVVQRVPRQHQQQHQPQHRPQQPAPISIPFFNIDQIQQDGRMIFDGVEGRSHVEMELYHQELQSIQNGTHNDWMSKFFYSMYTSEVHLDEDLPDNDRADALDDFLAELIIPGRWDQSVTADDLEPYNPSLNPDWWNSTIIRVIQRLPRQH